MAGFYFRGGTLESYNKPPINYPDQVLRLQQRGLTINTFDAAVQFLQHVNYYRFSAYCIPFQNPRDVFLADSSFEKIVELYRRDEDLRNNVLKLLSPIEIFLRTRIVYELSHGWGRFAHYNPISFRDKFDHKKWIASLEEEVSRAKETFIAHYKAKYTGFPRLPIWMACEIMSMGSLSLLYNGLLPDIQRRICSALEIHHFTLANWMHFITYLRNICAHHSRLWNRELAIRPYIPHKDIRWTSLGLNNERLFSSVVVAEWICRKALIPVSIVEPVHDVMLRISALDARFAVMMGVPAGREIGICWGLQK
jgi:abortive infection bacteriophage resistance protein